MKSPLRYQITEFDCGAISLTNCLIYLFEREEIPAELIRNINLYTLDCYDEKGNLGQKGTSREAVKFISRWITDYSKNRDFGVKFQYLEKDKVSLDVIEKCLKKGGCVNLRTYLECDHYVTLTGVDKDYIYLFDPYYEPVEDYKDDEFVEINYENPFKYNKKVKKERFTSDKKLDFALGPVELRECVLVTKKKKKEV